MRNICIRKGLVLGIIVLFLGVSVTPTIGISNNEDTTPPVTSISFNPEFPTGLNDWYITPVTITLVATDDMSGVNTTYYSINSESWEIYNNPFILTEDSLYHIIYFSIDNAGNMEFPKLATVKVDQTPPFVSLTYELVGGNPLQGWELVFTAVAVDQTSGMERVEFDINDVLQDTIIGPGPIYQWILKYWSSGVHVIKAEAFEQSGLNAFAEVTPEIIFERFVNRFPLLRLILQPIINIMSRGMKYA